MPSLKVLRCGDIMPWEYLPISLQALIIVGVKENAKIASETSFHFENGLMKLKNLKLLKLQSLSLDEPERIRLCLPKSCLMDTKDDKKYKPLFDLYNNILT